MSGMPNTDRAALADAPAANAAPLQVRTSAQAILAASFVPAAVFVVTALPFFVSMLHTWHTADWSTQILKIVIPTYVFGIIVLVTVVPAAIAIGVTHALARRLQRMRGVDYALTGAGVSFVVALATVSWLPVPALVPTVVLAGGLMGTVYRRFAGLEPLTELSGTRDPARPRHAAISDA
jgi:hypothetical protein